MPRYSGKTAIEISGPVAAKLYKPGAIEKNWAYTGLKIGIYLCLFLGMPNFFLISFANSAQFLSGELRCIVDTLELASLIRYSRRNNISKKYYF